MNLETEVEDITRDLGIKCTNHGKVKGYFEVKRYLSYLKEKAGSSTLEHSMRTALKTIEAARALILKDGEKKALFYGALLHDMGKTVIGKEILDKADFNKDDMEKIKMHPIYGYALLKEEFFYSAVISLSHHSFQKEGYPEIKKVNTILSQDTLKQNKKHCMIVSLVDFYDSITHRDNKKYDIKLNRTRIKERMYENFEDNEMNGMINCFYSAGVFK